MRGKSGFVYLITLLCFAKIAYTEVRLCNAFTICMKQVEKEKLTQVKVVYEDKYLEINASAFFEEYKKYLESKYSTFKIKFAPKARADLDKETSEISERNYFFETTIGKVKNSASITKVYFQEDSQGHVDFVNTMQADFILAFTLLEAVANLQTSIREVEYRDSNLKILLRNNKLYIHSYFTSFHQVSNRLNCNQASIKVMPKNNNVTEIQCLNQGRFRIYAMYFPHENGRNFSNAILLETLQAAYINNKIPLQSIAFSTRKDQKQIAGYKIIKKNQNAEITFALKVSDESKTSWLLWSEQIIEQRKYYVRLMQTSQNEETKEVDANTLLDSLLMLNLIVDISVLNALSLELDYNEILKDSYGNTACHVAVVQSNLEIVQWLYKKEKCSDENIKGLTPADLAAHFSVKDSVGYSYMKNDSFFKTLNVEKAHKEKNFEKLDDTIKLKYLNFLGIIPNRIVALNGSLIEIGKNKKSGVINFFKKSSVSIDIFKIFKENFHDLFSESIIKEKDIRSEDDELRELATKFGVEINPDPLTFDIKSQIKSTLIKNRKGSICRIASMNLQYHLFEKYKCNDTSLGKNLHDAIINEDVNLVVELLEAGVYVNSRNGRYETALYVAAGFNNQVILRNLIEFGADVNAVSRNNQTALVNAIDKQILANVHILIEAGITLDGVNDLGQSNLDQAVLKENIEIVEALLIAGIDVNTPTTDGGTVLFTAILGQSIDMIQLLITWGIDANIRSSSKETALGTLFTYAYRFQNLDFNGFQFYARLEMLLSAGAHIDVKLNNVTTPLLLAVSKSQIEIVKILLGVNDANESKITSLVKMSSNKATHQVLEKNRSTLPRPVQSALSRANALKQRNQVGYNALGLAIFIFYQAEQNVRINEMKEIIRLLIIAGADTTTVMNKDGKSALQVQPIYFVNAQISDTRFPEKQIYWKEILGWLNTGCK